MRRNIRVSHVFRDGVGQRVALVNVSSFLPPDEKHDYEERHSMSVSKRADMSSAASANAEHERSE